MSITPGPENKSGKTGNGIDSGGGSGMSHHASGSTHESGSTGSHGSTGTHQGGGSGSSGSTSSSTGSSGGGSLGSMGTGSSSGMDTSSWAQGLDSGPESKTEGPVARFIEQQTSKLPSDVFLWAAVGAMATSATLHLMGMKDKSRFFGQWVAPMMLFGVYNKIVKTQGSDQLSN
jgi:hypothetical protein